MIPRIDREVRCAGSLLGRPVDLIRQASLKWEFYMLPFVGPLLKECIGGSSYRWKRGKTAQERSSRDSNWRFPLYILHGRIMAMWKFEVARIKLSDGFQEHVAQSDLK